MSEAIRPSVTYILLIRHGENEWVSSGKLAGRTPGVHLNEKGRDQAQQLAELLAHQPIRAIYSSPLVRCLETAQPVAERLGLSVCEDPGLLEVDYGDWHARELKELGKLPEWQMVQHFPSSFRFPGGEALREVQQRSVAALERIAARHPNEVVALFSHGDVIRTTLAHYAGTALDLFQRVQISTASISTIGLFGGRPAILNMNVTANFPVLEIKLDPAPQAEPQAADQTEPSTPEA